MSDEPKLPPSSRLGRLRKLATLSAEVGVDVLARGVKRLAGGDPQFVTKGTAEKLVATLGDLKGAAMKLGQAVSMDSELLTPEVQAVLARLQNQAPPMPPERVAQVIQEEFGKTPDQLFRTFDPNPLAAASLGQVHRATLDDGREVAVKVQYPGIGEALTSDLENLGTVIKALSKTSKLLDGQSYFQELRGELILEIDYRREAALAKAFAEAVAPLADLKVPDVVDDRTSERVLTLELLPGKTIRDFIAAEPSAPERFRVSRLLIRGIYGPFLLRGEIQGDPHPGNFVVMPDGRLGLIDFGSVKRFSPLFAEVHRRMFKHALEGRGHDVIALCEEVGFSIDLPHDEARPLMREILNIAGRPLRTSEYDYAQCEVSKDMKRHFRTHAATFLKIRPPAEAVMFFRSTGGLSQNLRAIGAKGNFRAVYEELGQLV
jgi:predicted unusual protein kinase regulating ubiquinone biosynthesis (AarF/ABC1/UbiB family)